MSWPVPNTPALAGVTFTLKIYDEHGLLIKKEMTLVNCVQAEDESPKSVEPDADFNVSSWTKSVVALMRHFT